MIQVGHQLKSFLVSGRCELSPEVLKLPISVICDTLRVARRSWYLLKFLSVKIKGFRPSWSSGNFKL